MSRLEEQLEQLSPERRVALQRLLRKRAVARDDAPVLGPRAADGPVPLSFAQARLWFLDRLHPGTGTYNMVYALRMRGALDPRVLRRALGALVRRHESLRTTFQERDGEPVQVVHPPGPVPLPLVDLSGLTAGERDVQALRLSTREAALPFDLERGPVIRATLFRLEDEEHAILLTLHHIAGDTWSMTVLERELAAFFEAYSRGEAPDLPPLPIQYPDFAAWQRAWLSGERLERLLAYWRARLAGAPSVLELPTDHPRPPVPSDRGDFQACTLVPTLTAALRALARNEDATVFMVLLAAWQTLLARWTATGDVVVGTPVAGRTRVQTEGLIGFFANTLVLRTDLSGDPTVRELLARVRETVLGAFDHQELPFEKLVEELAPERSLAHSPLFQVMIVVGTLSGPRPLLGDMRRAGFGATVRAAKFDLNLQFADGWGELSGGIEYRTDLFDAPTVARMARHLRALLEGMAADPERRVSEIPLLDAEERRQVVEAWNDTAAPHPADATVHALFAAQAARAPGAVAVVFGGETLTYAELDSRANRLARWLRGRGVGPEARVGVCLERSLDLPSVLLGALKAGAAYVPLDPGHPADRLAWLAEDAGLSLLLTTDALRGRVPATAAEVWPLERAWAEAAREDGPDPRVEIGPDHLAYVIYTSGSTGRPKGVGIPHRALASHMAWMKRAFPLVPADRVLQKTPLGFDASVWEFYAPLLAGAALVLAPPGAHRDPHALTETLAGERITILQVVPSLLAALLDAGGLERCATLRRLFCGGEPLPADLVARARDVVDAEVVNLYGPTEVCIDATAHRCGGEDAGSVAPIGRPVDRVRAYVLDRRMAPVPPGVAGELFLGGAQLARGYLRRPGLTAEKFVPDPFAADPGARLYRTGDRVRWRADGTLAFLGRADDQVKLRGFRIEPGEVEAALRAHPTVRDAAVVVREDAPAGPRLVGYVVAAEGEAVSTETLRDRLAETLPDYMVPTAFVFLAALPLTPSGKVDRRALPAPAAGAGGCAYLPPRDTVELAVAGAWEEVLGVRPVGVRDDFFALGGHSLLAVRMLARVERRTGARLPVAALFAGPTVERLAALVRGGDARPASPLVPVQASGSRPPLFFVHPAGGNVLAYAALARHLGPDQPFYALQSRGLHPGERPHETVEAMADDYLAELRTVQPAGPYRLGGWSMGGAVAYEMARRLRARGEEVALLALVDAFVPALTGEAREPDPVAALAGFALHLAVPLERVGLTVEEARAMDPAARLARVRAAALEAGVVPPDVDDAAFERLYRVYEANSAALERYVPGACPGEVVLFRADLAAEPLGWDAVAGRVTIVPVPGDHFHLLDEPHVRTLAEALSSALTETGNKRVRSQDGTVKSTVKSPERPVEVRSGGHGADAARSR